MKILVLSDLHLKTKERWGKDVLIGKVSVNSRTIDKIKTISRIIKEEKPDVLISAGDVFDVYNPTEAVRTLFFQVISHINKVFLVSDNHSTKNGFIAGTSESKINNNIVVVNPDSVEVFGDITMVGYTRNEEEFIKLCNSAPNKFLIAHHDPTPNKNFDSCFYGHIHNPSQTENAYSIGTIFKNNWNEEFFENRYLVIEDGKFEFMPVQDLKMKTFTQLEEVEDGLYDIVRFKIKDKVEVINAINQDEIKSSYKETIIEFDLEVQTENYKVEEVEDIHLLIKDMLKDKNLSKEELLFGKSILEEV